MTAPSGKEGSAEATRVSAAAAAPMPNIESASRRVHFVARGSAFMSMAPFSGSNAASQDSGIVGKLGARSTRPCAATRCPHSQMLLERNLDKASQLARMQALRFLGFEL